MTFRHIRFLIALVAIALTAGACGSSGTGPASSSPTPPYAPTIIPADFTDAITNGYFPLMPGTTYVFEGTKEGVSQHNEVTVTHDTKTILGVRCVVVHDVVSEKGKVVEDTFDWYAQDKEGNVWYFGEETKEYENGKVTGTKGTWQAGVDGAQPGIVMKGTLQVGDTYRQEYYAGEAEDMAKVIQTGQSITVTAGSYQNVLVTEETTPLTPGEIEHKSYALGVGFVAGTLVQGGSEETSLVSITRQ